MSLELFATIQSGTAENFELPWDIVNAHAHLGEDVVFDERCTEAELLSSARFGVTATVVQPFLCRPYLTDTRACHDRIFALCRSHPGRFYGLASINPHFTPEDYSAEAARCVRELNFVGIKITPIGHAVNPESRDCRFAFETARALNVPVMVHTGSGAPFADPIRLAALAESFPKFPLILAHAGTDLLFSQALYLAERFEQILLEPSWLSILCLKTALEKIGASRIMFSSDHVVNLPVELAKYHTLLSGRPRELAQVLAQTARSVFGLKTPMCADL